MKFVLLFLFVCMCLCFNLCFFLSCEHFVFFGFVVFPSLLYFLALFFPFFFSLERVRKFAKDLLVVAVFLLLQVL